MKIKTHHSCLNTSRIEMFFSIFVFDENQKLKNRQRENRAENCEKLLLNLNSSGVLPRSEWFSSGLVAFPSGYNSNVCSLFQNFTKDEYSRRKQRDKAPVEWLHWRVLAFALEAKAGVRWRDRCLNGCYGKPTPNWQGEREEGWEQREG